MSVDPDVIEALSTVLKDLQDAPQAPIPPSVLKELVPLTGCGTRLKIDLDASRAIGAPLVTVFAQPSDEQLLAPLTPRQRQVAQQIIAGKSNREIADAFGISLATVKDHVHAVLQRLKLPSRRAVMAAARKAG